MTQEQKNKMKSIKNSLKLIYEAVEKHVALNDPKILALPDYGLILGTTTLLMEDEIVRGTEEGKAIAVYAKPTVKQQAVNDETEFNNVENDNVISIKKPKTFH